MKIYILKPMLLPLLWRYLFVQYGKTLMLSLLGFLILLLSTRLEDAAKLVSLGSGIGPVLLYIMYQIPYVLQIALPISTLIGALYLFQRLSANSELTAARASGIGLFELLAPLMLFSVLIAVMSFELFFDLSARAHLEAKKLEYSVRETQPLAILQNTRMLESRGVKLDMKGSIVSDKHATDLVVAMNTGADRTTIILAKKLASGNQTLHSEDMTLITSRAGALGSGFDDLIIENVKENSTSLAEMAFIANKHRMWKAGNDLLSLPLLLARRAEFGQKIKLKVAQEKSPKNIQRKIRKIDAEIVRRFSLALSIVTFTLVGSAFGCTVGRMHKRRRFVYVVALTAFFLVCYLAAKSHEEKPLTAICLYLIPHVVLIYASIRRLSALQKGAEV
ncbi:MAG: LptF/LptG family permease [Verrucomicrobia bacterium]|nr:LptF/LptG family permease [Verrucomicrobiota bacterium]